MPLTLWPLNQIVMLSRKPHLSTLVCDQIMCLFLLKRHRLSLLISRYLDLYDTNHVYIYYSTTASHFNSYFVSDKSSIRAWNMSLLEDITSSLVAELTPELNTTDSSSSVKYMYSLVTASFFKFYIEVLQNLQKKGVSRSLNFIVTPDLVMSLKFMKLYMTPTGHL